MKLIFHSNPMEVRKGEVLLLRDAVGQLSVVPDETYNRCDECVMNNASVDAGDDGSSDPCTRLKLWRVCGLQHYFLPVEPTEEIERARDLLALKGELL